MGDDWNELMQSWLVRLVLYAICMCFSLFYGIDAACELVVGPSETSAMLIEQIGSTAYVALTVARAVVCFVTAAMFARVAYKIFRDRDEQ